MKIILVSLLFFSSLNAFAQIECKFKVNHQSVVAVRNDHNGMLTTYDAKVAGYTFSALLYDSSMGTAETPYFQTEIEKGKLRFVTQGRMYPTRFGQTENGDYVMDQRFILGVTELSSRCVRLETLSAMTLKFYRNF